MFQMKEQDKTSEKDLNEIEMNNLPEEEIKMMVIKMLTELRRTWKTQTDNCNKDIENIRK